MINIFKVIRRTKNNIKEYFRDKAYLRNCIPVDDFSSIRFLENDFGDYVLSNEYKLVFNLITYEYCFMPRFYDCSKRGDFLRKGNYTIVPFPDLTAKTIALHDFYFTYGPYSIYTKPTNFKIFKKRMRLSNE